MEERGSEILKGRMRWAKNNNVVNRREGWRGERKRRMEGEREGERYEGKQGGKKRGRKGGMG